MILSIFLRQGLIIPQKNVLDIPMLLPQTPKCLDYRYVPTDQARIIFNVGLIEYFGILLDIFASIFIRDIGLLFSSLVISLIDFGIRVTFKMVR
jgi:hypothetical protein